MKITFHGFFYRLSEQLFCETPPVGCFRTIETAVALRDCDLGCQKCYPRKVILNSKTCRYMLKSARVVSPVWLLSIVTKKVLVIWISRQLLINLCENAVPKMVL